MPPTAVAVAARRNSGELESHVLDMLWAGPTPLTPAQTQNAPTSCTCSSVHST